MEIEKSILTREGFELRLANSPDKLSAFREAMARLNGDDIEQTLFLLSALAAHLAIPWSEEEKRAVRRNDANLG